MSALSIQIPDNLRPRVAALAAESGFDSVEAYIEAMVWAEVAGGPVTDDDELEKLLLRRIDGPFVVADEADFRRMRAEFEKRLNSGKPGASR